MKPVDTVCNGSKKLSTHWCSLKLAQFAGSPPCNHAVSTADFWEWWTLGNGWESISIELQSPAVSIRVLAGFWWVICPPERDLFDQWPHLIMCPLCPFIKVTTALRLIFILNLGYKLPAKTETIILRCNFANMLKLRFENEMNVQMNIFVGTSTTKFYLREHNGRCLHSITPSMPQLVKLFAKFLMQTGTAALQFCFLHLIRKQRHHKNTSFALSCVNFIETFLLQGSAQVLSWTRAPSFG